MTMAKRVCAEHFCRNTRQRCPVSNPVPDGSAGYRLVGHVLSQKQLSTSLRWRTFPPKVIYQRPGNRRQQWKLDIRFRLGPTSPDYRSGPIDVFEPESKHLSRAQSIG